MKKNYVRLEGNVGFTPRVTPLESGTTVMRLSIATNDRYKNRAGEFVDETVWHNIVAWEGNGMPDFNQIHTGAPLTVIGKIKPVQYTTKAGIEKMTYEIVASQILLTAEQKEADLPEVAAEAEETPLPERNKKKKDK